MSQDSDNRIDISKRSKKSWKSDEIKALEWCYRAGMNSPEMSEFFGRMNRMYPMRYSARPKSSINKKLRQLGLSLSQRMALERERRGNLEPEAILDEEKTLPGIARLFDMKQIDRAIGVRKKGLEKEKENKGLTGQFHTRILDPEKRRLPKLPEKRPYSSALGSISQDQYFRTYKNPRVNDPRLNLAPIRNPQDYASLAHQSSVYHPQSRSDCRVKVTQG